MTDERLKEAAVEDEPVGARIRRLRLAAGLSQEALAAPDLSASYVSLLEAGKRVPSDDVIRQLSRKLDCTPEHLLGVPASSDTIRLELELRYAEMALRNGDWDAALTAYEELQGKTSIGEHRTIWYAAELGAAQCLELGGRLEDAVARLESLRSAADGGAWDAVEWLTVVTALSRCYRELGDLSTAIEIAEATLARVESEQLPPTVAFLELMSTLVGVYCERGDLNRAEYLATKAIDQAAIITDRKALGAAYWNASVVLHSQGRSMEALRLIGRAVAIYAEGDDERALARVRNAYAAVLLQSEAPRPEEARDLLCQNSEVLARVGSSVDVAYNETSLARAELMLGNSEATVEHIGRALELLGPEHRLESARAWLLLAAARLRQSDRDAAKTAYERGALMLEASEAGRQAAFAWSELAEILEESGENERAIWAYRQSMRCLGHRSGLLGGAVRSHSDSGLPGQGVRS
ncbi:helix-turn-helix domain-containing protein [Kutzneria sp. CA-103260]|uniref:helix-turn-helix domain-containing protein n=1 Tax=Kutzneria sp. CA-103260 TaxID=2802641 RepID=UPI001BA54AE1|nr:helix-turn-helix transcriptional regulator [Kutzneria sp. CA-103260]QUQ68836.1 XRE family transcriptional regulator [Kutzneria sp. CA-103260]